MASTVPEVANTFQPGPTSAAAEESLRALLPGADPLAAQAWLCKELSRLAAPAQSGDAVLRAVLALDAHAHHVGKRLLAAYAEGDTDLRAFDARYLISARLLSRSFAQAYERLFAYLQANAGKASPSDVVTVIVQLFRHRQSELLLRLLRYKRHSSEQWRQLYVAYRYAQAGALENEPEIPKSWTAGGSSNTSSKCCCSAPSTRDSFPHASCSGQANGSRIGAGC